MVACEFDFLAGSIGVAAAERITAAVERATAERLPLVASPSSGGTRMQEGTVAFLQMVKIAAAVELHKQAHLPYLVYLRHPTTGGVFASWGSLGPRHRRRTGRAHRLPRPPGVRAPLRRAVPARASRPPRTCTATASSTASFRSERLRSTLDRALKVLADPPAPPPPRARRRADARRARVGIGGGLPPAGPARRRVSAAARNDRAGAAVGYRPRRGGHHAAGAGPVRRPAGGGARSAARASAAWSGRRRCARLAAAWRWPRGCELPLVLVIDTAGPALSVEAEQDGLAGEIARCLAELVTLDTPTVSVLLGQGSGGPALAMVPADRVLAALHGWLAPLPPEGASAIVYRDTDHAAGTGCSARHSVGRSAAQRDRRRDRARTSRRRRRADGVHATTVGHHRQRTSRAALDARHRAARCQVGALSPNRALSRAVRERGILGDVEALLHFAGNFWWLIFPLGGVIGGGLKAVRRPMSVARERRLERYRIKQQTKIALAEASNRPRNNEAANRREMTKVLAAPRQHRRPLAGLRDRRRQAAGLSADDRYARPADHRLPQGPQPRGPAAPGQRRRLLDDRDAQLEYRDAVHEYVAAFEVAEAEAIRRRRSDFSAEGQERLERAQNLLRLASDGGATPRAPEAYARARKELDGLIVLPAVTRAAIERKIAGEIEA